MMKGTDNSKIIIIKKEAIILYQFCTNHIYGTSHECSLLSCMCKNEIVEVKI